MHLNTLFMFCISLSLSNETKLVGLFCILPVSNQFHFFFSMSSSSDDVLGFHTPGIIHILNKLFVIEGKHCSVYGGLRSL